jgi:hypothetical protein
MQKPGVLELVQQRQLASPDDAFYVSTGRWYTHNCSDFEAPPFNKSMWALSSHYQVRHKCIDVSTHVHTLCNPSRQGQTLQGRVHVAAALQHSPCGRALMLPAVLLPPCVSRCNRTCAQQKTKGDYPHVFFGVPPFDHTTCAKAFDYKTAAACPAAGNGTSPDMYHTIASYAHAILDK